MSPIITIYHNYSYFKDCSFWYLIILGNIVTEQAFTTNFRRLLHTIKNILEISKIHCHQSFLPGVR